MFPHNIGGDPVIVLLGQEVSDGHLVELVANGVSYLVSDDATIDLARMLERLGQLFSIRRLLLEGGAVINGSFFAAGLVDELSLLSAPALDGRAGRESFIVSGAAGLAGKVQLSLKSCEALQSGVVHLQYAVRKA